MGSRKAVDAQNDSAFEFFRSLLSPALPDPEREIRARKGQAQPRRGGGHFKFASAKAVLGREDVIPWS